MEIFISCVSPVKYITAGAKITNKCATTWNWINITRSIIIRAGKRCQIFGGACKFVINLSFCSFHSIHSYIIFLPLFSVEKISSAKEASFFRLNSSRNNSFSNQRSIWKCKCHRKWRSKSCGTYTATQPSFYCFSWYFKFTFYLDRSITRHLWYLRFLRMCFVKAEQVTPFAWETHKLRHDNIFMENFVIFR